MKKSLKKTLGVVLSLSMIAGTVVLPAATASAEYIDTTPILAEDQGKILREWKFDFGETAAAGWTQVTADDAYTEEKGYGFLGQDSTVYLGVVDGYTQTADDKTELKNGGTGSDAYHDYVYTEDDHMPIRFAVKAADNNTYYRVRVTMGNSDEDSNIFLTSERRHFVLTDTKITAGNTIEKTFTAAVHNVRWKNRTIGDNNALYRDDMINVCVHGENAMINTVEIQQIEKPKVLWVFGDSTTTDSATGAPWVGYNTYTGWGAGIAKFLPENIAVVNLAEGGLSLDNTSFFNEGKDDFGAGDILMMAMGHNGTTPTLENLKPFYDAITSKGGTFVSCAPIERIENASTASHKTTFQNFATTYNCPFVSLYDISVDLYNNTLKGNPGYWYSHTIFWKGTASKPEAERDGSHLNDFGVEWVAKGAFEALAAQAATYPVLVPYVTAQANATPIAFPQDLMTAKGTDDYKDDNTIIKPPHKGFPYPEPAIDYDNIVDITSATTTVSGGKTYLTDYMTVRHSDLSYITCWAAAYDANGALTELRMNRLEPMTAKTAEKVDLTKKTVDGATTEEACNPLEIPEGGSYKTFVWEGAFSDNSLTHKPYSDVFSGYDTTTTAGAWTGVTPDAEGTATIASDGKGVYALTTPATSGKVMFDIDYTVGGDATIVLSPAADGSAAAGALSFALKADTGVLSTTRNGSTVEVIDSLKKDATKNIKFIYDIDYGKLEINMDGVGIAHVDYPEAITSKAITPAQIASIAISGAATVENAAAYTVATDALPDKTLTITYDGDKGKVTATGDEAVITSKTAAKNTAVQLTATATPTDEHNYVFGGWYSDANHTTLYDSNAAITVYIVDDLTLYPYFYEQAGVEGVTNYTITAKSGENNMKLLKQPETSADITLDITDIVDRAGNPTAAFDHGENVTWAIKGGAVTGASISGNTLTVTSALAIPQEEMKTITVTATCNSVSKDYDIVVHNFTNLIYNEDFEGGTVGEKVDKWSSAGEGRCMPLYAEDANGNKYLDMYAIGTNNGTTLTGNLLSDAATGVVQVKMDVLLIRPFHETDPGRQSYIGLKDSSGKFAVTIAKSQTPANFKVNGVATQNVPSDTDWMSFNAVLNYVTKTADIKITSLDGTTTYYNETDVPFESSEAANFSGLVYETNRTEYGAKIDNIFVNNIAAGDAVPTITASPETLEFTTFGASQDVTLTIPSGSTITDAASADEAVATVTANAAENKVTITSVASGDTTVTVTVSSTANAHIKNFIDIPVGVKKNDNADLKSLTVTTNGGQKILANISAATTTYNTNMASSVTSLTLAPVTDHSGATYAIKYNDSDVTGTTITIDSSAAEQKIEIEVTAPDNATTKTYTINIDNSWLYYEDFNYVAETDSLTALGWSGDTGNISLASANDDYSNYILLSDSNNRGKTATFTFPTLTLTSPYVLEFDMGLVAGNTDPSYFYLNTATSKDSLFTLDNIDKGGSKTTEIAWKINDSESNTLTVDQSGAGGPVWAHYKFEINPTTKAVKMTVTQGERTAQTLSYTASSASAAVTGFTDHVGRSYGSCKYDNIKVYTASAD